MKNEKRIFLRRMISLALSLTLLLPIANTGANAVTYAAKGQVSRAVGVNIDDKKYDGTSLLIDATTYVGIREFSDKLGADSVEWNDKTKTATVKDGNITVTSKRDDDHITANGKSIYAKTGIKIINGRMYVPIRTISAAFGYTVSWDAKSFSATVTKSTVPEKTYNETDLYWLSRIIYAEAGTESLKGKIAVGNVVLNRVKSPDYPNNIYDVIFDTRFGVQFSPISNGTIYNTPDTESIDAAKRCLDGENVIGNALFFMNPALASGTWISDNRPLVATIGSHSFYS